MNIVKCVCYKKCVALPYIGKHREIIQRNLCHLAHRSSINQVQKYSSLPYQGANCGITVTMPMDHYALCQQLYIFMAAVYQVLHIAATDIVLFKVLEFKDIWQYNWPPEIIIHFRIVTAQLWDHLDSRGYRVILHCIYHKAYSFYLIHMQHL